MSKTRKTQVKIVVASGKRKTAIARAVVRPGKGRVRINKIPLPLIKPDVARLKISEPLVLAREVAEQVDIDVDVRGGGFMGQAEAARTAIARGLLEYSGNPQLREQMMEYDAKIFVSDPRRKEPKKFGGRGARARRQKSYR
ncbi:MAG: 30S ribosomal protein S9 [Candidatus Freyarchaeota archaeon]|nr:30S ribosomal protein S9 [Candidatus Jordarchaeia archaeon]